MARTLYGVDAIHVLVFEFSDVLHNSSLQSVAGVFLKSSSQLLLRHKGTKFIPPLGFWLQS